MSLEANVDPLKKETGTRNGHAKRERFRERELPIPQELNFQKGVDKRHFIKELGKEFYERILVGPLLPTKTRNFAPNP